MKKAGVQQHAGISFQSKFVILIDQSVASIDPKGQKRYGHLRYDP